MRLCINSKAKSYLPTLPSRADNSFMHNHQERQQPTTIGQRITALMKHLGLKEREVLRRMGSAAVNQSTFSRLRRDLSRDPRDDTLEPIARVFGVTTAMLRGYEEFILPAAPPPGSAAGSEDRARLRAELISEVADLMKQLAQATDDSLPEIARQIREPLRRVPDLLKH